MRYWIIVLLLTPSYLLAQVDNSELAEVVYNRGRYYELDRNWQESLKWYKAAIELHPNVAEYRYHAAHVAAQMSHTQEARALLKVDLAENHSPSANLMGMLLLRQGKILEAKGWFEKALSLEPGSSDPYFGLARCAEESFTDGNISARSDAIAHYRTYLKSDPDGIYTGEVQTRMRKLQYGENGLAMNRAILVLETGQLDRAERMLKKLVPCMDEAYYWLGMISQKRGEDTSALDCWRKAMPLPEAQLAMARYLLKHGMYTDAMSYLEDIQRRAPYMVEAQFHLGRIYLELGRFKEAEQYLQQFLKSAPQHPEYLRARQLIWHLGSASPDEQPDWNSTLLTESQLIQRYGGEVDDPDIRTRLESIIERLKAGTPEFSLWNFQVILLSSDVSNAWPIPPNKILITKGLTELADTHPELSSLADDFLAFVLGHEMVHLVEHDAERSGELQSLVGSESVDLQVRQQIIHRTEYNADRRGALLAYQANFDPFAAVVWFRTSLNDQGDISQGYDHPTFSQRLERIQKFLLSDITEAHKNFRDGVSLLQNGYISRSIAAFEIYLSKLPTDTEARYNLALAYFLQGLGFLRDLPWTPWQIATEVSIEPMFRLPQPRNMDKEAARRLRRAQKEAELVLRQNENHACSWRLLGDIALAYRDFKSAHDHYGNANRIRPENAVILNNIGVLACMEKRWKDARNLFEQCKESDENVRSIVENNLSRISPSR